MVYENTAQTVPGPAWLEATMINGPASTWAHVPVLPSGGRRCRDVSLHTLSGIDFTGANVRHQRDGHTVRGEPDKVHV
jgi:hypothetical protein